MLGEMRVGVQGRGLSEAGSNPERGWLCGRFMKSSCTFGQFGYTLGIEHFLFPLPGVAIFLSSSLIHFETYG